MDNPLLIIPVSYGLISIVAGFIMLKFPPKKINSLYGYRTSSSMKSQERWNFAQIYSSKEMIKLGFLISLCGLIGLIYYPNEKTATILGLSLMILTIIVLLIRVELAIKKKFKQQKE